MNERLMTLKRNESMVRVREHEILTTQAPALVFRMGKSASHGNMYSSHPNDEICYHMRDGLSAGFIADGIHLVRT